MKGREFPSEAMSFSDSRTGARIRQITSHPSIHHHPFYYIPAYDDAMRRLYFVSHRSGAPQIYFEDRATGRLVQMTDRSDLHEWSFHPSHDGQFVYFTASSGLWRVDSNSLAEVQLAELPGASMRTAGTAGPAMGTTSVSRDDRWWAVTVQVGGVSKLLIVDCEAQTVDTILERDIVFHPQFHPDDPTLLRYGGPYFDRLWVINRDGSDNRLVYKRDAGKKEWIVHETWLPGRRELLAVNWPHTIVTVDIDSACATVVDRFNAWHPMVNRAGTKIIADTTWPDIGLQLLSLDGATNCRRTLCHPGATNAGDHWKTDHCPYDDGPVNVQSPQHTHPHPSFSPDSSRVVFTSDQGGHAQIYEVLLSGSGL